MKNEINTQAYSKQRYFCVTLVRKGKQACFGNINTTDVTHNKTFWRTVKLFFTDKVTDCSKITLSEKKVQKKKGNDRRSYLQLL